MTELEERLRHDLRELSERADAESIRPLRVPPARGRSRAVRWLAPVAAVAAVVGVITGVSLATRPPGPSAPQLPSSLRTAGRMPPYYVAVDQTDSSQGVTNWAIVHDSATGAALTTMRLPTLRDADGSAEGPGITGAGDGRTYVITETATESAPHAATVLGLTRFYLLHVAAGGRAASVSPLPVSLPGSLAVTGAALSPDGRRLALAVQDCRKGRCQYTGIRLVTLATGAVTAWTADNGAPFDVSWAGGGQIAFLWQGGRSRTGYRLLDVAGAGRNLLAASRAIAGPQPVPGDAGYRPSALVTPDGAVITTTVQNVPDGRGRVTVVARFVALSARTGQLLRVLYTAAERGVSQANEGGADQGCNVVALGPAGLHVLAVCFGGYGRLDGGRFTPLPGIPNPNATTLPGPYISGTATW